MAIPQVLPMSRVPDPASAPALRWGILAPGWIARMFTAAVRANTRQRVVAVGSRSRERAQAFADEFDVPRVHDSYRALVEDPEVDVVYVASPHSEHAAQALLAISAGKPALVEKAFAQDAAQAAEVAAASRAAGVAVMEAMWTRFLPRHDIVRQLLADGVLGDLECVTADHGQLLVDVPRLLDPLRAGGALLDLGVYPVSFACFALGIPGAVSASGILTDTAVDRQVAATFGEFADHPQAIAQVSCTLGAKTPTRAVVSGTEGRIELDGQFYTPGTVRLVDNDGVSVTNLAPEETGHGGLAYEAAHFAQLVADGATESPLLPLAESVAIMGVLDRLRAQVGVRYPGE